MKFDKCIDSYRKFRVFTLFIYFFKREAKGIFIFIFLYVYMYILLHTCERWLLQQVCIIDFMTFIPMYYNRNEKNIMILCDVWTYAFFCLLNVNATYFISYLLWVLKESIKVDIITWLLHHIAVVMFLFLFSSLTKVFPT